MMMKLFSCMAIGALLLCSCSSEEPVIDQLNGNVTFTATLPDGIQSRSAYDDGTNANTLMVSVYDGENNHIATLDKTYENIEGKAQKVELNLVTGKTYTVVFWAQAPGVDYYHFNKEKGTITVKTTGDANDTKRDAFFAYKNFTVTGAINEEVKLTRPFAQINIGTKDLAEFLAAKGSISTSGVTITGQPTVLDLRDGSVSGEADYVFTPTAIIDYDTETKEVKNTFPMESTTGYSWLTANFILAGTSKDIVEVTWTNDHSITDRQSLTYSYVPVQRNYRTNIYGSLLTNPSNFDVKIDENFDENSPHYNEIAVYDGTQDLDEMIAKGGTIEISAPVDNIDLSQYSFPSANLTLLASDKEKYNYALNNHDALRAAATGQPLQLILKAKVGKIMVKDFTEAQPVKIVVCKDVEFPVLNNNTTTGLNGGYSPACNITLEGDLSTSKKSGAIFLPSWGTGSQNVTIKNVAFDGALESSYVPNLNRAIIDDRSVVDNLLIENCTFVNLKESAVYISKNTKTDWASDLYAEGNKIDNRPNGTITVKGCTIEFANEGTVNTASALYILQTSNVYIIDNKITNAPYNGIFVRAYYNAMISRNEIFSAGKEGIKLEGPGKIDSSDYFCDAKSFEISNNKICSGRYILRVKANSTLPDTLDISGNELTAIASSEAGILIEGKEGYEYTSVLATITGNNKAGASTYGGFEWLKTSEITFGEGCNIGNPFIN